MKLKEVLKLSDKQQTEYFWYLKVVKPITNFKYKFKIYNFVGLGDLTYKDADYIKRMFFESSIESIMKCLSMLYKIKESKIVNLEFNIFIGLLKALKLEVESDLKEKEKLDVFSDQKIQMALKTSKAEIMNQFGIYNTIDNLAKGDKTKWKTFEDMKYRNIKFMLTFNTVGNSVNKKFEKAYQQLNKIT